MSDYVDGYCAGIEAVLHIVRSRIKSMIGLTTAQVLNRSYEFNVSLEAEKIAAEIGALVPPAPVITKPHIKNCTIILGPRSDISENIGADVILDDCNFQNCQLQGDKDGNCRIVWNGELNIEDMPHDELKARLEGPAPADHKDARIAGLEHHLRIFMDAIGDGGCTVRTEEIRKAFSAVVASGLMQPQPAEMK